MKRTIASLSCTVAVSLLLGACASAPAGTPNPELQLYRAHAGAKVESFNYLGHMDTWKALGDDTIAVWTQPREAWLIELAGICNNLEYSPTIGLDRQIGQVRTGSRVLIHDPSGIKNPCFIRTIRPLDAAAIRDAEKQQHDSAGPAAQGSAGT